MTDTTEANESIKPPKHFDLTINIEGENTYVVISYDSLFKRNHEIEKAQLQIENRAEGQQGDVLVHLGGYYIPTSRIIWIREY